LRVGARVAESAVCETCEAREAAMRCVLLELVMVSGS
jgi:hypothetical protein